MSSIINLFTLKYVCITLVVIRGLENRKVFVPNVKRKTKQYFKKRTKFENSKMTESLDKILLSPGLYWIGELIFVEYLESDETFANCELVCKKWQQFFIQANLWKRRIFCRMAKPGTYRRSLLERYPTWSDTESLNCLQAQSSFFRTLAFKFSKKSILSSWKSQK